MSADLLSSLGLHFDLRSVGEREYQALRTSVGWQARRGKSWAEELGTPTFAVAVRSEADELVAYASLHRLPDTDRLIWNELIVALGWQKRGIGPAVAEVVLEECHSRARTQGAQLRVYASSAVGKETFLKRLGFKPLGRAPVQDYARNFEAD